MIRVLEVQEAIKTTTQVTVIWHVIDTTTSDEGEINVIFWALRAYPPPRQHEGCYDWPVCSPKCPPPLSLQ
jgi:hypothetical protein